MSKGSQNNPLTKVPEEWNLEDESAVFSQYRLNSELSKRVVSKATSHCQFRCPEFLVRRVEMLLATRQESVLQTKSDVFINALFWWLDEWDKKHVDGANGLLRAQMALMQMKLERTIRTDFLEEAKDQLAELKRDGDVRRLSQLHNHLQMVYSDSLTDSPESYLKDVRELIHEVKRLVDDAQ